MMIKERRMMSMARKESNSQSKMEADLHPIWTTSSINSSEVEEDTEVIEEDLMAIMVIMVASTSTWEEIHSIKNSVNPNMPIFLKIQM